MIASPRTAARDDLDTQAAGLQTGGNSRRWSIAGLLFALGISMAPVSIAACESALAGSLVFRMIDLRRPGRVPGLPRIFWLWSVWALLELAIWLHSPPLRTGLGEIRHLALILGMFLLVPTLDALSCRVAVWRAVFVTGTVSSMFLIAHFVSRMFLYDGQVDPIVYFRDGGLVHHWMIYGTIETIILAAQLEFFHFYPEEAWWLAPAFAVDAVAILLSLTRMVWICSLLVLAIHLVWRRSRWIWFVPAIPFLAYLLAPAVVRLRVSESLHPDYYSNAERIQMMKVGWRMIREHPIAGIGPGRVDQLYTTYLAPSDPVPAYHGHLHNNLLQLAAEFGLPVTAAAAVFVAFLFSDLIKRYRRGRERDIRFLSSAGLLGLVGFLMAGLFDYTYGHSLGLILVCFAVLAPLYPDSSSKAEASPDLR